MIQKKSSFFRATRELVVLTIFSAGIFAQLPLEKAVMLTRQKSFAEARRALEGVPEPADANQKIAFHRLKAAIAAGLGEPMLAVREMRKALTLAPNDTELLLPTAISEMQAGLLSDALQHARLARNTPRAQAVVGDIEDKLGNYAAASNAYQSAVALAPDQEIYRVTLALELIQHQSFNFAIELLKQSTLLFPRSAKLVTLLGIANYASGYPDEAVAAFESAITIDPHFDSAYGSLARVLFEASAAPPREAVTLLCGWNVVVCSAARLRVAQEDDDMPAVSKAMAVLKDAPAQNAIARCELAKAYKWSHELEKARKQLEACVSLDPTPQNHYRLGMLYRDLGLTRLSYREFALRGEIQAKMGRETAAGLDALQAFKLALK
jgi:tetratricopeptide (TPR) repeat protein